MYGTNCITLRSFDVYMSEGFEIWALWESCDVRISEHGDGYIFIYIETNSRHRIFRFFFGFIFIYLKLIHNWVMYNLLLDEIDKICMKKDNTYNNS